MSDWLALIVRLLTFVYVVVVMVALAVLAGTVAVNLMFK